mmetsp:Transcript_29046/g.46824  ORF Transcript_29046/g.46824 Transcript_29046/m.46824 type:complete len:659 (+) Transcript_29046:298-2274(+)
MSSKKIARAGAVVSAAYMGWKYLDQKHNIQGDFDLIRRLLKVKHGINRKSKTGYNVTDMWYDVLGKNPAKVSMIFEDRSWTFQQVEDLSNRMSNWLLGRGLKRGDTVALLMSNRPEFVISWLGMTKIGVKVALINTAIKKVSLFHCVKISECKMLFFGTELGQHVEDILPDLARIDVQVCGIGEEPVDFCNNVRDELANCSSIAVSPKHREGINMQDIFGYIYTSGTTGLPKAAIILHQKMYGFGCLMSEAFLLKPTEVVYTCLPLFHSAGGGLGIGVMLYTGCTVVIKKRFSATDFWGDCVKYKCTVVQYIGELCRYLLLNAPVPAEKQHCVRIAIGNGLRPEIWDQFQERFNIPEVGEFYGSTEGQGALVNHCTTPDARGTVGRMGSLLMKVTGMRLVKFDVVEEQPVRGPDGMCIDCDVNEPGELLFIIKEGDPSSRFAGYSDKAATEKKILRDAFTLGDKYFRTGDLLSRDEKGYFRFVDRIGDTFRWKGENCSTNEISNVLGSRDGDAEEGAHGQAAPFGIEEINVYGVQIPNNMDGRAPMAAITPVDGKLENLDLDGLVEHAHKNLPSYSIPLFLRIQPKMPVTATMKHQKVQLRKEGIDLNEVEDPIFWLNPEVKKYERFTSHHHHLLTEQKAKPRSKKSTNASPRITITC